MEIISRYQESIPGNAPSIFEMPMCCMKRSSSRTGTLRTLHLLNSAGNTFSIFFYYAKYYFEKLNFYRASEAHEDEVYGMILRVDSRSARPETSRSGDKKRENNVAS